MSRRWAAGGGHGDRWPALAAAAAVTGLAGALSFGIFFVVLMRRLRQVPR